MANLKKKRGAPFKEVKADIVVRFMVTAEFDAVIEGLVKRTGLSRSGVIRDAIRLFDKHAAK